MEYRFPEEPGAVVSHNAMAKSRRHPVRPIIIALLFLVQLPLGAATPTITEYSIPTAGSQPWGIASGPDGAIWFTEGQKIGRITTSGTITEYPAPSGTNYLNAIAAGPDNALWFVTGQGSKIGRITTSGVITTYSAANGGDVNNQIMSIVVGGDGALWFTEAFANKIGRITTAGVVTEYPAPGSQPWVIVSGPDGALWFTETTDIGRITTAGVTSKYTVPTSNSLPWGIAVGPDNNMWFTEEKGGKIGKITKAGVITEFPVNSTGNDLSGITTGPDGTLWFSDSGANKIGQMTTAGVVTEYAIPTSGSGPRLLVAGPDGAIWFTEESGNKIGKVVLSTAPAETQLFTNFNSSACSQTGTSQFTLTQSASVTHWGVWYYWSSGETSVPATVKQGSTTVFSGNLTRASCDPYQTSWCDADGVVNATWPAGAYTVTITSAHMCMNSGSSNQGFVYIYGNWQAASSCTYALGASSSSPAAAGGTATVNVTSASGCAWTATSNANWITITAGASGTANGTVTYSVAANTTASTRTGTLTIGGQTFTVTQAASSGGGTLSGNLIQNGDAEAGPGGSDAAQPAIPFWNTDGQIAVTTYAGGAGDLDNNSPGPSNRGNSYFAGGPSNAASKMTQTVDLSSYANAIDTGLQPYTLDGWLGGYDGQSDNTVVTVTFQNSSGTSLGTATIGPVTMADRNGVSALVERSTSGKVPTGTRKILVTVAFTRTDGSYNDGLLDNLYFGLTSGSGTVGGAAVTFNSAAVSFNDDTVPRIIGWDFTPSTAVAVNALGFWTSSASGLAVSHDVIVYRDSDHSVVVPKTTIPSGCTSESSFCYLPVTPVTLAAGTKYVVMGTWPANTADGFTGSPQWASGSKTFGVTSITIDSRIAAGQGRYTASTSTLAFPASTDTRLFFGPNFKLSGASAPCTYSLSATSAAPGAAQTTGSVTVTAGTGCAWTATSNATWLTVTSGASGSGNGTVNYSVAANTGAARTGTLTIAGLTFTVTQAGASTTGCSYNVSPTDIHAAAGAISNTILIFTNSGCAWTASVPSGVTWITLNPTSGSGGGAVGYAISANTAVARSTTLTVAGAAVTVSQDAGSNCTYILSSTSSPQISGVGGVGSVSVTVVGTSCSAWSVAAPSANWVHVAAGSGSTSSGTVSYSVDSNSAASPRSTSLTIANQTYTISQAAAPCTYALSAANSGALAAAGAPGSFQVTAAGPACTWAITLPTDTNSQWIHVISSLNAMSSGSVSYTVDPNNTTSARSLVLTLIGKNPATTLTYTVNQAAGTSNTAPAPIVSPSGIVNAASFISADLAAGSIAQGSFFSIFGNNLGPPNPGQKANSYPLGTTLGGVSVKVTQGTQSVDAIPVFVAQYQINAVMPSNTPIGTVQVTVSYNGLTSPPAPVQVVAANFGSFTVSGGRGPGIVQNFVSATELPLNMTTLTAAPGDYAVLWGTGLGPLPGGASDTQPPAAGSLPVSVQVLLGNQTIIPAYAGRAPGLAGVDQIDFQLPSNVTLGCYVPLQVVVNGNASNTVTMAINNNRQPCSDTSPFSSTSRNGGKNGSVALARLAYTDPINALKIGNGTVDIAMATFNQSSGNGALGFSLFASLPPMNTCTYYNNVGSLNGLLGGQMPSNGTTATPLDAGPTITVKGPNGTQGVSYSDSSAKVSPYLGVLGTGGGWSALGLGPSTPFLDPGTYTVSGSGGKDVGPFQYTIQIPAGASWTNRDSITSVDRSKGLTVQWSGGNASTQAVVIIGYSSNPANNVSGGFACLSDMAPQSFTVPSSYLVNLPATPTSNPGNAISALMFATVPVSGQFVNFSASATPSLDSGLGYYAVGELRNNVIFQ